MDYTYHNVRPTTVAKLNAIYPDIKPGSTVDIRGMGHFCFDGTWQRMRPVREKPTEFLYQILFGDFPGCKGGIAAVLRTPARVNWHKVITPAVKRLIRKLGRPADTHYQFEYDSGTVFNGGNYPRYVFDGRDFVEFAE